MTVPVNLPFIHPEIMTGKVLDNGGPGALILLLPIALAMVVLVTAWPLVLSLLVFSLGVRFWQNYQWKQWCRQVDPFFHQLIRENRGCITPMDLSMKANLTGRAAKKFLDKKAEDYGAQRKEESTAYYFITASALGSIFDDSEPEPLDDIESPSQLASASAAVEPPPASPQVEENSDAPESEPAASQSSGANVSPSATARPSRDESRPQEERHPAPSSGRSFEPAQESARSVESTELSSTADAEALTKPEPTPEEAESEQSAPVDEDRVTEPEPTEEAEPEPEANPDLNISQNDNGRVISNKDESELALETSIDQDALGTAPTADSESDSLIQAELAKRLDMHSSTIGKRKSDPDFSEWSQSRDPQGIAWTYVPETKMFVPLEE